MFDCASEVTLEDKVRALRSAAAYDAADNSPEHNLVGIDGVGAGRIDADRIDADRIQTIETHFAWVFLTADRAYKLKKPLELHGVDLTTLTARHDSCAEEVRLNRRLAPETYLGVSALRQADDGRLHIGEKGRIVDWLVTMRRLPSDRMLNRAIALRSALPSQLKAVGTLLANFYGRQPTVEYFPERYLHRISVAIERDARELASPDLLITKSTVEALHSLVAAAFAQVRDELADRAREGRIVEGHGDLRPEHICLTDPPCIIDALEFSSDLRILDPGEELAFLSIECERLGDLDSAAQILSAYLSERADTLSARLLDFYRCRRATVRAIVTAWHLRDPEVRDAKPWSTIATGYMRKAQEYGQRVIG